VGAPPDDEGLARRDRMAEVQAVWVCCPLQLATSQVMFWWERTSQPSLSKILSVTSPFLSRLHRVGYELNTAQLRIEENCPVPHIAHPRTFCGSQRKCSYLAVSVWSSPLACNRSYGHHGA